MNGLTGAVLGLDAGFSQNKATTGLCLLNLTADGQVTWTVQTARSDEADRLMKLHDLVGDTPLLAVAVDGPLTCGLRLIHNTRTAESLLLGGEFERRGKPGPTKSKTGQELHKQATLLARFVLTHFTIVKANQQWQIHDRAIVEAFPNAFLAVLHPESGFPKRRDRNWTDCLYPLLKNELLALISLLIPGSTLGNHLEELTDHEHRAALVCALTALSVAKGRYVAIGDRQDGWIVLPPLELWGEASDGSAKWAARHLRQRLPAVRRDPRWHGEEVVLWKDDEIWEP